MADFDPPAGYHKMEHVPGCFKIACPARWRDKDGNFWCCDKNSASAQEAPDHLRAVAAYAAVRPDGYILVRTISDSERAAQVNWLCTERGITATITTSTEQIHQAFMQHADGVTIQRVKCTPYTTEPEKDEPGYTQYTKFRP